ncbi:hypothetical protein VIOR3934_15256 [Vibrio orientalis CIP 102891 = ATCC 33934]|uniref:Uncharacterized protein n=1 Tax=Vibrio orientalis CIP 102891 = ATCC 33934 TaxID=675816 RepID=F9SZ39_VIBOR|nr:hypothetical protein VIOR3934_15256 [Vibrio orientalis CIP 102891 = ATCC 33934]
MVLWAYELAQTVSAKNPDFLRCYLPYQPLIMLDSAPFMLWEYSQIKDEIKKT